MAISLALSRILGSASSSKAFTGSSELVPDRLEVVPVVAPADEEIPEVGLGAEGGWIVVVVVGARSFAGTAVADMM